MFQRAVGWPAPCVRLFRARLPKASQLGQKGPVVRKQASFERRLTVRSSEIRCSVSPWRCFGRAPLGPHRVQALGPRPSPQSWAHPFDDPKTPGVDLHEGQCVPCPPLRRRRSFARAANVLTVPILSSGRLPLQALPRHPHVSSTTAQHLACQRNIRTRFS